MDTINGLIDTQVEAIGKIKAKAELVVTDLTTFKTQTEGDQTTLKTNLDAVAAAVKTEDGDLATLEKMLEDNKAELASEQAEREHGMEARFCYLCIRVAHVVMTRRDRGVYHAHLCLGALLGHHRRDRRCWRLWEEGGGHGGQDRRDEEPHRGRDEQDPGREGPTCGFERGRRAFSPLLP